MWHIKQQGIMHSLECIKQVRLVPLRCGLCSHSEGKQNCPWLQRDYSVEVGTEKSTGPCNIHPVSYDEGYHGSTEENICQRTLFYKDHIYMDFDNTSKLEEVRGSWTRETTCFKEKVSSRWLHCRDAERNVVRALPSRQVSEHTGQAS